MVKNILITGASGLIGGILAEHLSKNPNYDVYGTDKHIGLSVHYQIEKIKAPEGQQPILPPKKFYICDITDKDQLSRIIRNNRINIIIHLAAVLVNDSPAYFTHINCDGTKILFDIATKEDSVEMIIYASSARVVFGYLDNEPYSLLVKNIKPTETLKRITIDDPPMPAHTNACDEAYSNSKVYGEELARQYSSIDGTNVKFICARFGLINLPDSIVSDLYDWSEKTVWCSHRDLCQFIDRALENQLILKKFQIYFVCSNNDFCWIDIDPGKDLNYIPQDSAKWDS